LATARETVEQALRRVAEAAEDDFRRLADGQRRYFDTLSENLDLAVLASDEMWR